MNRRRLLLLLTTAAIAAPTTASARKVTIKVGTVAPKGSVWHDALKRIDQRWKKASDGKVKLRIFPGGVAGDESDMLRKMRIGQLHMGSMTGVSLAQIARSASILSVPMLIRSHEELDYVRERMGPRLKKDLADKGFVVLAWGDAGWAHQFSKAPARTPDDFRKLKYLVWTGDPAGEKAWRATKFNPVPLSSTDVLSGLRTGMIEAFGTTPLFALSSQWFGLAKHMVAIKWSPLNGATLITRKRWEKIPAELRPQLEAIAIEESAKLQVQVRSLHDKAIGAMVDRGLKVHTPTPAEVIQWEKAAELAYPIIRGEVIPADVFDEVRKLAAEYRAKSKN